MLNYNEVDARYLDLVEEVLAFGTTKDDRTKVGTISSFGHFLKFDLSKGFPILTTKKVNFDIVKDEMIWLFIKGSTNTNDLQEKSRIIWRDWADEDGSLGAIYGKQARQWISYHKYSRDVYTKLTKGINNYFETITLENGFIKYEVDQIKRLIWLLKNDPNSRRMVLNLWNVGELPLCNLPPCFLSNNYVKTQIGYKPIREIERGEKVLNSKGEYEEVTEVFKTNYSGNIYNFKFRYIPNLIECTPNHPFYVDGKGYIEAKDIQKTDYVGIPINNRAELPKFTYKYKHNIWRNSNIAKEIETQDLDFWYIMGYFLGDGWLNIKRKEINFAINNKQVDNILPMIRKYIKVCKKNDKKSLNCYTYNTYSHKYLEIFKEFGHKAHNKIIPQWVEDAPIEFIKKFLEGYADADGCIVNKTIQVYTTTSPHIALGIQRLYAKIGLLASITFNKKNPTHIIEGRIVNQRDTYSVRVQTDKSKSKSPHYFKDNKLFIPIVSIDKKEVKDEFVYNLEVGLDHTYTINNIINHNCHYTSVFNVNQGKLNCHVTLRSNDLFLGNPFNISSYALLTNLLAHCCDLEVGELALSIVDAHIYSNHVDQVKLQLSRYDRMKELPQLWLNPNKKDFFSFGLDDISLIGYEYEPYIKAPIAV